MTILHHLGQSAWRASSLFDPVPNLQHESVTPIPDRGTPEVRQNRIANLKLAASKIHQLQIDPGKIFSFCECVGNPTTQNGFQAGPVFVQGQVKTGVGGGLCLMATNRFDLFLFSGCQVLERHCHSIDAYGTSRFYRSEVTGSRYSSRISTPTHASHGCPVE